MCTKDYCTNVSWSFTVACRKVHNTQSACFTITGTSSNRRRIMFMWYMVPWNATNKLCNVMHRLWSYSLFKTTGNTNWLFQTTFELEIVDRWAPELSQLLHVIKYHRNWINNQHLQFLTPPPPTKILFHNTIRANVTISYLISTYHNAHRYRVRGRGGGVSPLCDCVSPTVVPHTRSWCVPIHGSPTAQGGGTCSHRPSRSAIFICLCWILYSPYYKLLRVLTFARDMFPVLANHMSPLLRPRLLLYCLTYYFWGQIFGFINPAGSWLGNSIMPRPGWNSWAGGIP